MQNDHSIRVQHIRDRLEITRDRIFANIEVIIPETYGRLTRTTDILSQADQVLGEARERLATAQSLRHDHHHDGHE